MQCRLCNSQDVFSAIELGVQPLANNLLTKEQIGYPEATYNLQVMVCQNCGLAQLKDLVPPQDLFAHYVYFSSNSTTMLRSAEELTKRLIPCLNEQSLVVEIASNDGYLLKNYVAQGIDVLGIDPAQNIAAHANENGINTLCAFFNNDLAESLVSQGKLADVIHANNVMDHVPDIHGFMQGIKQLLKPNGTAVIEVPYLGDLIKHLEFDTIYHEHVYYFSVKPLAFLCDLYDLTIDDIEKLPLHGGSLRLFIKHKQTSSQAAVVEEYLRQERDLNKLDVYTNFMQRLRDLRLQLKTTLDQLKISGKKIAGYGASAKGATFLNFFGIDATVLDFVVDRSPVKQGLYTPGTHLLIDQPEQLIAKEIDYALLLTWNFAEEILQQQKEYRAQGGRFIIPIPQLEIV